MFKFKDCKISLIALILSFMMLLTACEGGGAAVDSDLAGTSSGDLSTITQGDFSAPDGTSKPSASGNTIKPEDTNSETFEEIKAKHVDKDNNGKCDDCNESVLIYIDFFAVNDLHGKICDGDNDTQPGVDELTTYFKLQYQSEDNVVVLSSGDMWQGSAESNLTNGNLTTEWMNYVGFESMTVGNHEYDWGSDDVEANAKIADFPILAINIYANDDNQRVDYCKSSVLIERDGVKIGIIGAAGNNYSSIAPYMVDDIYFKTGKELTSLVKAESEKLRKQGAQIIIYSLHDGYDKSSSGTGMIADSTMSSYYDSELSSGGYVDVVFEAHTHQNYVLKDAYGVYHLQGGGENKGISHVEFAFNAVNLDHRVTKAEYVSNSIYKYCSDDPIVDTLQTKYEDKLEIARKVLGNNPSYKNSDYICDLVAQLYYQKGVEKWGDKYDIVLGGGFLQLRNPYNLPAGNVKYSQLLSILPFDNELVLCSIKGSDLKSKFFETTNSSYHIYYEAYGQTVKNSIQSNKTYYIIVDRYTSSYTPNRLTEIAFYGSDIYARDLLADYIQSGKLK